MTQHPPGPAPRTSERPYHRLPMAGTSLKLDANEGARPPQDLVDTVREAGAELLRRYPNTSDLEVALAERLGIDPQRVYATAGADDAIQRCCWAFLRPGREALLPKPGFYLFERCARLLGNPIVPVPWLEGPFPRDAFLQGVSGATALVAIISPSNPTGAVATFDDVHTIARHTPRALVVLDHAYVEYADEDLTAGVQDFPNVVVLRTLSKAWGLAGCRVGYVIGAPEVLEPLRAAGQPYSVAAPSAAMARQHVTTGKDTVVAHVSRVREERRLLTSTLQRLGLRPLPSQANFILVDCADRAAGIHKALEDHGIVVRAFPEDEDLATFLRITLPGDEREFAQLTRALTEVLA